MKYSISLPVKTLRHYLPSRARPRVAAAINYQCPIPGVTVSIHLHALPWSCHISINWGPLHQCYDYILKFLIKRAIA